MTDDEKTIYDSMLGEYQQALSTAQFNLARANGQLKAKDQKIVELTRERDAAQAPSGPQGDPGTPEPAPSPAR